MPDATILADFMTRARDDARRAGSSSTPSGCARTSIAPAACTSPRPCCSRSCGPGLPRQDAYVMVQRCALAAITRPPRPARPARARPVPRAARRRSRGRRAPDAAALDALLRSRSPPAPRAARSSSARSEPPDDRPRRRACARSSAHTLDAHAVGPTIGGRDAAALRRQGPRLLHRRERGERIIVVTDRLSAFDAVRRHDPVQGPGAEPARAVLVRADRAHRAEPHAARARSERDDRARVHAAAGRARDARVPDRRDLDVDLEGATRRARARSAATRCPTA